MIGATRTTDDSATVQDIQYYDDNKRWNTYMRNGSVKVRRIPPVSDVDIVARS
jgi:hypothetical protein